MVEQVILDENVRQLIGAIERLKQGDYSVDVLPDYSFDGLSELSLALNDLAHSLRDQQNERLKLDSIITQINAGFLLDDLLENIYRDFREIIPYNRIGFSLIENEGQTVRARWAKSDQPSLSLDVGFSAPLSGSSLFTIIETGQPRIINDLPSYLEEKPESESTRLIVEEGMQSSLTCPLIVDGQAVGFIFFSSVESNTYANVHVGLFLSIAQQLSVMVDKGRLVSELVKQRDALVRFDELKDLFIGMAAHDLRNPLGLLKMTLSYLVKPDIDFPDEVKLSFLHKCLHQIDFMTFLLDDLLEVIQVQSRTFTLRPEPFVLKDFLDEVIERHTTIARSKGTRVVLEGEVPNGEYRADTIRLRQVMDNLISNAVKFSPPGSLVTVNARETPFEWQVHVRDEGPGIMPEDREYLFKSFSKLSAEPTGGELSTGLGLAIVRRIIEEHGGRVEVDSEPGKGADFWFGLPLIANDFRNISR